MPQTSDTEYSSTYPSSPMHIASEPFPLNQLGLQSQLDALAAVGPEQAFMTTDLGDAI